MEEQKNRFDFKECSVSKIDSFSLFGLLLWRDALHWQVCAFDLALFIYKCEDKKNQLICAIGWSGYWFSSISLIVQILPGNAGFMSPFNISTHDLTRILVKLLVLMCSYHGVWWVCKINTYGNCYLEIWMCWGWSRMC